MSPELKKAYEDACQAYKEYKKSLEQTTKLEKIWLDSKRRFEFLDREAAESDGRLRKVTVKDGKAIEGMNFTKEQVIALAARLGIDLRKGDQND